jgi:hypothetical protein
MSGVEDMILGDEKVKQVLLFGIFIIFIIMNIHKKFDQIDNFFQLNGKKILMLYYQEIKIDAPTSNLGFKTQPSNNKKKLVITTGEDEVLFCNIELYLS